MKKTKATKKPATVQTAQALRSKVKSKAAKKKAANSKAAAKPARVKGERNPNTCPETGKQIDPAKVTWKRKPKGSRKFPAKPTVNSHRFVVGWKVQCPHCGASAPVHARKDGSIHVSNHFLPKAMQVGGKS